MEQRQITIILPNEVIARLDTTAEKIGNSRNDLIRQYIAEKLPNL